MDEIIPSFFAALPCLCLLFAAVFFLAEEADAFSGLETEALDPTALWRIPSGGRPPRFPYSPDQAGRMAFSFLKWSKGAPDLRLYPGRRSCHRKPASSLSMDASICCKMAFPGKKPGNAHFTAAN